MSRHPSPGPSHAQPQNVQIFQQVAVPPPRQKSKAYATGIAAGAEDVKYQTKYKELKRKVKEIEADNDKLQFKVLQAKRSVQRMKVERAVLYERLSVVPPSPDLPDRQLPPIHSSLGVPPQVPHGSLRETRGHPPQMDPNDHALMEYLRTHDGNVRVIAGPDGRPVPVTDPTMGLGVTHGFPGHAPRRGSGHDSSRQLPPLSHLPSAQHFEPARIHGLSQPQSHSHSHNSPHVHPQSGSSHERTRSRSSTSRTRAHQAPGVAYHPHTQKYSPETLPPVQHVLGSPSIPGDRERSRRHDLHELTSSHGDHPHTSRHHTPLQARSPPHTQSVDTRRVVVHPHQRMGPGAYTNRADDQYDREYERDKDREWDRREIKESNSTRMHSPPYRPRTDSNDRGAIPRPRDEQGYYEGSGQGPGYSLLSRSGTPGSGSGSGSGHGGDGPSRPDSRTQIYDRERIRYALRPVSQAENLDFVHEDGRSPHDRRGGGGGSGSFPIHEQNRPSLDSRKRSRNDMDVDDNDAVDASSGTSGGASGGMVFSGGSDDRGSKRFHPDGASTNPNRGGEGDDT